MSPCVAVGEVTSAIELRLTEATCATVAIVEVLAFIVIVSVAWDVGLVDLVFYWSSVWGAIVYIMGRNT